MAPRFHLAEARNDALEKAESYMKSLSRDSESEHAPSVETISMPRSHDEVMHGIVGTSSDSFRSTASMYKPFSRLQHRKNYESVTRSSSVRRKSSMLERRVKFSLSLPKTDIRRIPCCNKGCFRKTDHVFLRNEAERVLLYNRDDRRRYLHALLEPNSNRFYFSGKPVCCEFLEFSFKFSRHLQTSVKKACQNGSLPFMASPKRISGSPHRDAVICFLERLSASTADMMPDSGEKHLPLFEKKAVYEMFCDQFTLLYSNRNPPTLSYFYNTWNTFCANIKVRRVQRFTKCSECEYIRDKLEAIGTDIQRTAPLLERRQRHIEMVARERREYQKKCEEASLYPSRFTSLIVDGADQSGYGLPHFTVCTKATVGHSLKVRLIGVLEHGVRKHLSLYTLTAEFETGANHIIEAIHRTLTKKAMGSSLQGTLYLQVDNCTRENKNTFLFCYLECLVAWGVFEEVHASFLPIGHTHADIDQAFSCTSRRLRSHNAVTMEDLVEQLRVSYTPEPSVSRMLHVANFSGLCRSENSVGKVHAFSKFRYFRFHRSQDTGKSYDFYRTACDVKIFCEDNWKPLPVLTPGLNGFLVKPPELKRTPSNIIRSPPDRHEVLLRFRSEESRVNNNSKMDQLHELLRQVYEEREDSFHWNLTECFEMNGMYRKGNRNVVPMEEELMSTADCIPLSDLPYSVNRFVAVNGEDCTTEMPFWLGQIMSCKKNNEGVICQLCVRWYEVYDGRDAWSGKYRPAMLRKGRTTVAWKGHISVDTVIAEFPSLTNKMIRAGVEKEIRSGLASIPK